MGRKGDRTLIVVLAVVPSLWIASAPRERRGADQMPPMAADRELRLHVIPLCNAEKEPDGTPQKRCTVTPQEFADLVGRVNLSFAGTGLRFVFDPEVDWAPMADTELNTDGPNVRSRCNAIAAGIPGKVVCFLRFGADKAPTGNGNAYPPPGAGPKPTHVDDVEQNYVALPSAIAPNFGLLNQGNGSFVAHELGHYLGLYHTFPGWTDLNGPVYAAKGVMPTAAQADQAVLAYALARGGTIDALDGDGLSDTPPDPSPVLYGAHGQDVCAARQLTVTGTVGAKAATLVFSPDPENAMSYFAGCAAAGSPPSPRRFSPMQVRRMTETLKLSSRRALVESPAFGPRSLHVRSAVARDPGRLEVVATDQDGRVWIARWAQGGSWDHWRPVLGDVAGQAAPASVVARDGAKLDVFLAGKDGKTYTGAWERNVASGQWRGWWNVLVGTVPPGGTVTAVSRHKDKLDAFLVSDDGGVYTAAWEQGVEGNRWRGWFRIGNRNLTAKPGSPVAAVARDQHKLDVFVAGSDGKTYAAAWEQGVEGSRWRGWWNVLGGTVAPGAPITAVSRGPTKLDLFLVSTDGGIYTAAWDQGVEAGKWRGWFRIGNLTAKPGSPVAAVARDGNKLDVFVAGADGRVHAAAWEHGVDAGKWRGWWNVLGGAVPPGSPIAAVARDANKLDLFIVSTDGRIHTAAWDRQQAGGQWRGWWRVGS
jgi:hypothetical protein